MSTVIQVDKLSKCYRLGTIGGGTLRADASRWLAKLQGKTEVEIKKKFDEFVAFAEIEEFIDTPVKRYSSGMYVRLAFAVAAHLEPEILIVDEVLAVGDAAFQQKCIGKMQDVSKGGRTV